jgi:hypothetical protein
VFVCCSIGCLVKENSFDLNKLIFYGYIIGCRDWCGLVHLMEGNYPTF